MHECLFFYSARSFIRPPTLLICPLLDFYLHGPDIGGICSPSGINSDNFFGARDRLLFSRFFFFFFLFFPLRNSFECFS